MSEDALSLHSAMLAAGQPHFSQIEVQALLPAETEPNALISLLQELINLEMVKLLKQDNLLFYAPVSVDEAEKVRNMSADEALVYSFIQAAGREGIWTRTIKTKGNLHLNVVMRCIKSLESQRYIKAVKSVKFPTRKIYMLYQLQPSIEVTGGPWYTDSELDTEFVALLQRLIWQFVCRQSFPAQLLTTQTEHTQLSYPPSYDSYPTLDEIHEFVANSGVATVSISLSDTSTLCDVLVFDDKIEIVGGPGAEKFRATLSSLLAEKGVPKRSEMLPKSILKPVSVDLLASGPLPSLQAIQNQSWQRK